MMYEISYEFRNYLDYHPFLVKVELTTADRLNVEHNLKVWFNDQEYLFSTKTVECRVANKLRTLIQLMKIQIPENWESQRDTCDGWSQILEIRCEYSLLRIEWFCDCLPQWEGVEEVAQVMQSFGFASKKVKPQEQSVNITIEQPKPNLQELAQEYNLKYHQQDVAKGNQCVMGRNGRLWVTDNRKGFDITLSGQSLIAEMTPFMRTLTGSEATGSKQTNCWSPYWRVTDWDWVRSAVEFYAQTRPCSGSAK